MQPCTFHFHPTTCVCPCLKSLAPAGNDAWIWSSAARCLLSDEGGLCAHVSGHVKREIKGISSASMLKIGAMTGVLSAKPSEQLYGC